MKLTPLYTAIECRQQSAALQDLKLGMPAGPKVSFFGV